LKPQYHCFIVKDNGDAANNWIDHLWLRADTFDTENVRLIAGNSPSMTDIWPIQNDQDHRLDCWAGATNIRNVRGLHYWSLDPANNYDTAQLQPLWGDNNTSNFDVEYVRAVYPIDSVLESDPDKDAIIEPGSPAQVRPAVPAVYAGLRSSNEIYVHWTDNDPHSVPSPWPTYTGIAADKHYLWVFQPFGFACATHASVLSCVLKKRQTPRWMQYSLPTKLLGRFLTNVRGEFISSDDYYADITHGGGSTNYWVMDGQQQPGRGKPALKGLISMSPCEDGTIFASIVYREASSDGQSPVTWMATDRPKLYTKPYAIDVGAGAINVDEPWT
jgi:hypothetical protein